jgi:hypothetical protein
LLGLGILSSNIYAPTRVETLTNVVQASAGQYHSFVTNSCNSTSSGGICQNNVCFGVSSAASSVCSGVGVCVAPDQCKCDLPSKGLNCENKEYHWIPGSGKWSATQNWGVVRNGKTVAALFPPSAGDSVYFDLPGKYTIDIDVASSVDTLSIGNDLTFVTITIPSSIAFTVTRATFCSSHCQINISPSSMNVFGNFTLNEIMNCFDNPVASPSSSSVPIVITIAGVLNYFNSKNPVLLPSVNMTITNTGIFNHVGTAPIVSDGNSRITNYGLYNGTNMKLLVPLLNFNSFLVGGNDVSILSAQFVAGPNSVFTMANTTLIIPDGNLTISNGLFSASGTIQAANVFVDVLGGYFRLLPPFKWNIVGNAIFSTNSTVFLNVNGFEGGQSDTLNVTGTLLLNSLVLLKLGTSYSSPMIGQKIPVLVCGTLCKSDVEQLFLLGAPYKNAKYSFDNKVPGIGYLEIIFSYGSVDNLGYECTYLGNKRILEMNTIQNTRMLTLTIPIKTGISIGFGFDYNGNINNSLLVLSDLTGSIQQVTHNSTASAYFIVALLLPLRQQFLKQFSVHGQIHPLEQVT